MPPQSTYFAGASNFGIGHLTINSIAGNQYQTFNVGEDLIRRLNPILDASHTRNRKKSPPDSPGTREEVILEITTWGDGMDSSGSSEAWDGETSSTYSDDSMVAKSVWSFGSDEEIALDDSNASKGPHIYWLHGFAGCGKLSVSLEVAKIYAGSGRLLASFFFFHGAGDRGTMERFAVTLASQLMAPYIEAAVSREPGLVTGDVSLAMQLDLLVLSPFQAVVEKGILEENPAKGPFLIVIDGLDECSDKTGVEELIDHMLDFFKNHPTIPLRLFVASRVEQHIRARLEVDGVRLGNLNSHWHAKDIEKFLQESFNAVSKRDRVIQAYVRAHGQWPTALDMDTLVEHVGQSFVLASTTFKFIIQPATEEDPSTPMERFQLALQMNGLDTLYAQTLIRSQNLPHFRNIISAITRLAEWLPIAGIAELLAIETFEVTRVLLNLQAIIHVPGTDEEGNVTLCHSSLRDFLTTKSRSGPLFVPPSFDLYLSYSYFSISFDTAGRICDDYSRKSFVYWTAFAYQGSLDDIEQLKARQPVQPRQFPFHAFLCHMFFRSYCWLSRPSQVSRMPRHLFHECAKALALAAECPDTRIEHWLRTKVSLDSPDWGYRQVKLTEQGPNTLQDYMQRASTAIHAKFPELLRHRIQAVSIGAQKEYRTHHVDRMSGMDIFNVLDWIVARAQCKWEEMKITPRLPLILNVSHDYQWNTIKFMFDMDGDTQEEEEEEEDTAQG